MPRSRKNVLLVEDNQSVAEMITQYLEYAGIHTIQAFSVEDAITIIDEEVIRREVGGLPDLNELQKGIPWITSESEDDCCEDDFSGELRIKKNVLPEQQPKIIDAILLDGSLHHELDSLLVLARVKHHKLSTPVIAISGNPESNRILCRHGAVHGIQKSNPSAILGALFLV